MTVRTFASSVGHKVVGRLSRRVDLEYETNWFDGSKVHTDTKAYIDEAGNVYFIGKKGSCIVTADDCIY